MRGRTLVTIIFLLICLVVCLFVLSYFSSKMNMKPATLLVIALLFIAAVKEKR